MVALFYGAVFLDEPLRGVAPGQSVVLYEPLRVTALVGLALILAGVAIASGLVRPLRRQQPVPAPTP